MKGRVGAAMGGYGGSKVDDNREGTRQAGGKEISLDEGEEGRGSRNLSALPLKT